MRRYLPSFAYVRPKSVAELEDLLEDNRGQRLKLIAGGTDLLVSMRVKNVNPESVVSFRDLPESLDSVSLAKQSGALRIGAMTTIRTLETSELIRARFPLIAEAASQMGSYQIRNRATIGGNICNASPAADMVPPLMVLDSKLEIESRARTRLTSLDGFFTGPGKTTLAPNEFVKGILVNEPKKPWGGSFLKVSRASEGLAIVNVASFVRIQKGRIAEVRIALGAVAPTPVRASHVEELLTGMKVPGKVIEAADAVVGDISPIDDVRSGADYRRHLSKVLVDRSLRLSIRRAAGP